jgi:phenylalanyl-tRNA synthetase beta chain
VQLANAGGSVHVASGALNADAPKWAAPLFGLELEIIPGAAPAIRYQPIPATQASERDLALLVPEGVTAADVLAAAKKAGGQLLEKVKVIDEYRGKGLPAGTRSVAFRLTWRSAERTLRDEEIEAGVTKVRKALEQTLGVTLRTA